MAIVQSGGFCSGCNKQVVVWRKGPTHVLHALLSLLSAGLWLIVWLVVAARAAEAKNWICSQCGQPVSTAASLKDTAKAVGSSIKRALILVAVITVGFVAVLLIFG